MYIVCAYVYVGQLLVHCCALSCSDVIFNVHITCALLEQINDDDDDDDDDEYKQLGWTT